MGQIVTIGSGEITYKYELPSLPREEDIWYYDVPKKEQYWKTPFNKTNKWLTPSGELYDVKKMKEKEKIEYISYFRRLWKEGLWIMVNGEPTYLCGAHLDHLIFNKFGGQHLFYLDSQRERFYFRDLTNKANLCDGRVWVKPRRAGLTTEQITEAIRVVLSDYNNKVGMQSTTLEICNRTLMKPIIDTYISRVSWMREVFYTSNGRKPIKELQLTSSVLNEDEEMKPLGGFVKSFPTVASALDGDGWMLVIGDEKSKWETCSPREALEINKKAILNPLKRGKIDALSTVGDSKEAAKAVVDWHKLISDSNPKVLNANGKTNSGLWLFFVSALDSLLLLSELPDVLDKYGKVNKEMALEYIHNDINQHPKDSKEYIYAKYKMPLELRDALLTPTGQGYFSKIRITHRLDQLREMPNDRKPYVMGSLEYDAKGNVYFESNIEREERCKREGVQYVAGYWRMALMPYFSVENNIDTRNRFRKSPKGIFFPPINPEGCIGYDPIRYKKEDTTSNSLSEAAIIAYKKFDYYNSGEANQYCALYLHRPDDPREANAECIKAAKFFGYPVMHERVIETVKEDFETANMLPFLMKNPKDDKYGMWIDSQGKVVKNALDWMVAKFNAPIKSEDDVDYYATHPFEETLMDMDAFDIAQTTQFDCFMAMIELEHGLKQILFTNLSDSSHTSFRNIVNELIPARR